MMDFFCFPAELHLQCIASTHICKSPDGEGGNIYIHWDKQQTCENKD